MFAGAAGDAGTASNSSRTAAGTCLGLLLLMFPLILDTASAAVTRPS